MKKIAIFQVDLGLGGIQKSLYNLLCSDLFAGEEVNLFLFSKNAFYDIEKLPSNINITYLQPFLYYYRFVPFEMIKNKKIKGINTNDEYDIAVDFSGYSQECAVAVYQINAKKKFVWVHNDVQEKYKEEIKYRVLWTFFKEKYKYYDYYVAVSKGAADSFSKKMSIDKTKIICAPNIILAQEVITRSTETCELQVDRSKYNLISTGRLCHQKGFDILLQIMEQVMHYRQDIKLYIVGSGPDKKKIEKIIKKKQLEEYVELLGAVENPYKYMQLMDGYILMSRYEGQGIVLSEAKILGLELYFPKRLEKYNLNMLGNEDIVQALCLAKKREKVVDSNEEYLEYSIECYRKVFF